MNVNSIYIMAYNAFLKGFERGDTQWNRAIASFNFPYTIHTNIMNKLIDVIDFRIKKNEKFTSTFEY